jgi:hypothetical protein
MVGELTGAAVGWKGIWDTTQTTPLPISPQITLPHCLTCSSGIQADTVIAPSLWMNWNDRRCFLVVMLDY